MGSAAQLRPGIPPPSAAAVQSDNGDRSIGNRSARPFLKWAGGKRQLLPALQKFYPGDFEAYHEPFLGSGAVFFDLANAGRLRSGQVHLGDVNADLVGCWLRLRDDPNTVVEHIEALKAGYGAAPEDHYYRIRKELNRARQEIANGTSPVAEAYTAELAAMFIYLNRTGYNGLFRLNSRGLFNVPRGRYKNPRICDADNLRQVSSKLTELSAHIEHASFRTVVDSAQERDFVYFDPPYAPMSTTAQFTSYTAGGFGIKDQRELQRVLFELVRKRCYVVLSNSTAPEIKELYKDNAEAKELHIDAHLVRARRAINSNAARRGHIDEYIITNVPGRAG